MAAAEPRYPYVHVDVPAAEPRYPYVHVDVPAAEAERVADRLFELGAQGIEERDAETLSAPGRQGSLTLVAYVPDEAEARAVAKALGRRYRARVELVIGDAWRDAWKEHFKPTRVGARLLLRPSWEEGARVLPGEVVITLDPGRAFGSGTHETTRLVLRELGRRVRGGERVLDVGCGSGILSIAAVKLGAASARALDVDPDAVDVTRENATRNRVASRVRASTASLEHDRRAYDLVVANIEARVLVPMAPALASRVRPGGSLVLSGILRAEWREVAAAYPDLSLRLVPVEGEWVALVFERRSGGVRGGPRGGRRGAKPPRRGRRP